MIEVDVAFRRFRRLLDFVLLRQILVLPDGCGDGGGCRDSVVENYKDSVVDMNDDCDIEDFISFRFLLRYAALATLCFFNRSVFLMGFIIYMVKLFC